MGIDSVMHAILSSISYNITLIIKIMNAYSLILHTNDHIKFHCEENIIMDVSTPFLSSPSFPSAMIWMTRKISTLLLFFQFSIQNNQLHLQSLPKAMES